MGQLSRFFDSKFMGCMIVGQSLDPHRQRTVTLYALHDEPGMVGIYDGIDRWATHSSTNPFGMRSADRLADIEAGKVFEIESGQTMRREHDEPGVHPMPVTMETAGARPRRRAVLTETINGPMGPMEVIAHPINDVLKTKERRRAAI